MGTIQPPYLQTSLKFFFTIPIMSFIGKIKQTYTTHLSFFSFLSGPAFNLGSCMGFSCQVSLVSLTWGQFFSPSLAFMT